MSQRERRCEDVEARLQIVRATGSASFNFGGQFSFYSGMAFVEAWAKAGQAIERQLPTVRTSLCQGLCPDGCECVTDVHAYGGADFEIFTTGMELLIELIGDDSLLPDKVDFSSAGGWSGGGTWTVERVATVTARCVEATGV